MFELIQLIVLLSLIIITIVILIHLLLCSDEYFTNNTFAGSKLKFINDPSSAAFNYIEFKDDSINVPNALMYTHRNLYNDV